MGMTDNQILRQVELPLAMPEILAGVRIAFTTTVGLATLAFFAGGGGLGEQIYSENAGTGGLFFKSNVVVAGGLAVLLAAVGDLLILAGQRIALPWRRVATGMRRLDLRPARRPSPAALRSTRFRASSSTSASRSPAASASAGPASSRDLAAAATCASSLVAVAARDR